MHEKVSTFDVAEYLDSDETIAEYLSAILEQGDTELLLAAIGDVAKARGMSQIATSSGLGRESLYKAFAPGAKPRFETILKVLNSMGVQLQLTTISNSPKTRKQSRSKKTKMEELPSRS